MEVRYARCMEVIRDVMPAAEARWDSRGVIEAGKVAEADLEVFRVCKFKGGYDDAAIRRWHAERMGRAYSRQGDFPSAISYYDKFIALCVLPKNSGLKARGLCLKGEMQVDLKQLDGARLTYEHAQLIGEHDGLFEVYSKACTGLSNVARLSGDKKKGLELAKEGLKAVGFTEPGDYGKKRDESKAILAIISCSNVDAVDFDETLLERLTVLGVEIDADPREGGSTTSIHAASMRGARHVSRMRHVEAVAAYQEVVEMAKEGRFAQMEEIQRLSARAMFQIILHS